jgi:hypothetical protein
MKVVAGAGMPVVMVAGLASPASANNGPPNVRLCQQAFAASGLAAIRAFQDSNKSPEARASLAGRLSIAEVGFFVCINEALSMPPSSK